jgi:formate dehydrogenase subunit delta
MSTELQRLIDMANQISTNLALQGCEEEAVEKVANHIKRFWARSMKDQVIEYSQQEENDLLPLTQKAITLLAQ